MKLKIEIEMDNSAFDSHFITGYPNGMEVVKGSGEPARITRYLADWLGDAILHVGCYIPPIRDRNGNKCGTAEVVS